MTRIARGGLLARRTTRSALERGSRGGVAVAESWEEDAQGGHEQHQVADVADPCRHPVAPGRGESDQVAEACARVAVDAGVDLGLVDGQALEDEGEHEHAHACDEPSYDQRARRCGAGHLMGEAEDAAADHRADDQCDEGCERDLLARGMIAVRA